VESPSPEIVAYARNHRIDLLLADRLRLPEFAGELRAASAMEAIRERELKSVLAVLADAGVRAVIIKGASIAQTHYPRPELRPRSDTDLLVAADQREATARALMTLGYEQPPETDGPLTVGQFHFQRLDRYELLHALDVHWRISNVRAFSDSLTYEEVIRDAIAIPALAPHALSPSGAHALLIACVHLVAHHGDSDCLLWLFDVHLLASRLTPGARDGFAALAAARGLRAVCASTLERARTAFGGIEEDWIESLKPEASDNEPSAAFLGASPRQVDLLKADLKATPRLPDRLRLVAEHLFPSATYMHARYGLRFRLALPFLYVHRAVSGAPKWFRR